MQSEVDTIEQGERGNKRMPYIGPGRKDGVTHFACSSANTLCTWIEFERSAIDLQLFYAVTLMQTAVQMNIMLSDECKNNFSSHIVAQRTMKM